MAFGKKKTGGRKAGTPNKVTTELKTMIEEAVNRVGGIDALVYWARSNPDLFWSRVVVKLLPRDVAVSGDLSVSLKKLIEDAKHGD